MFSTATTAMRHEILLALLATSLLAPLTASAAPAPRAESLVKALCEAAKQGPLPKTIAWNKGTKYAKDSCIALYYGFDGAPNYTKALECATEHNEPMLYVMAYANGYGVPKNVRTAIHLACNSKDLLATDADRLILRLAEMNKGTHSAPIDVCDEQTSRIERENCEYIEHQLKLTSRARTINALKQGWGESVKAKFYALEATQVRYAKAQAEDVSNTVGSLSESYRMGSLESSTNNFYNTLQAVAQGKLPPASEAAFHEIDTELNTRYREKLDEYPDSANEKQPLSRKSLRQTARRWIEYRDAWVRFAAFQYPAVPANALRAYLTKQRISDLEDITSY